MISFQLYAKQWTLGLIVGKTEQLSTCQLLIFIITLNYGFYLSKKQRTNRHVLKLYFLALNFNFGVVLRLI